jgi:hypothetical protein
MKPTLLILLLALFPGAASTWLRAQTAFEGVVESRNTTTDELGELQRYTMTLRVKGDMVRTEISAFGSNPASVLIYRRDLGVVWILDEKGRTFFEMRTAGQDRVGEGRQEPGHPQIRKTGRSKKILGFLCDQLILRSEEAQTEYWGTRKLTALAATIARAFGSDVSESNSGMNDALAALGYFPMIARTKLGGRVIESSEVTKIIRCSLEDHLFAVPSDYRKETAPDMP